ncbi:MAG TPA: FAD-dependent oxidoreductase [Gaiellaceae bacterium]|jgi:putative aminophosphonate oxidoreductase
MRSLWLQEALVGAEDAPRLEGSERADVCIVGGGYTGLWTAIRLKEHDPALDVVLVEADICGGGASGRNGGFVLSWWAKFGTLKKVCGGEEAVRLAQLSAQAVADIGAFCSDHDIDAHYRHDGWLWAATSEAQMGAWDETLQTVESFGVEPFVRLDREETARRAGEATHLGGVFEPTAATVQPALLARGLRRVALERGVRIFEHSPMTRLERSRPPRILTARGEVTATKVVLALNAWIAAVRELRRAVVVIASDVVATAPAPERLAAIGWTDGSCISDSRMLVNYYRNTLDGRVVLGRGGGKLAYGGKVGTSFDGPSPRADVVTQSLHELYPSLADVPITNNWMGPIDRTMLGVPFFSGLAGREDLLYGLGYSGNGVGPTYLGGKILASLALGLDDEWSRAGLVRDPVGAFPPEPARYVGGRVVRSAVERKEAAEDRGELADRLTLFLADLAPAGLVPLKKPAATP